MKHSEKYKVSKKTKPISAGKPNIKSKRTHPSLQENKKEVKKRFKVHCSSVFFCVVIALPLQPPCFISALVLGSCLFWMYD